MAVKDYTELDHYWAQFTLAGHVFKRLGSIDVQDITAERPELIGLSYKSDIEILSRYLTHEGKQRLLNRFKNWKSRQKHNKTSITITGTTLMRLQRFASLSGFSEDSYDLMFEYLLDPDEAAKMDSYKRKMAQGTNELATSINKEADIHAYLMARYKSNHITGKHIQRLTELAFQRGWLSCKQVKGKKTEEHYQNAFAQFIQSLEQK